MALSQNVATAGVVVGFLAGNIQSEQTGDCGCDIKFSTNILDNVTEKINSIWETLKGLLSGGVGGFTIGNIWDAVGKALAKLYQQFHDFIVSLHIDLDSCHSKCEREKAKSKAKAEQDSKKNLNIVKT